MTTDVGVVTTTADGTVLFDSRDENLFLYSSRVWSSNAPASITGSFSSLRGYSIVPLVVNTNGSNPSDRGRQINVLVTYDNGYPRVQVSIKGSGRFSIRIMYMQSNRLRSTYAEL